MAYQYGVGGTSPIMPPSHSPIQRAVTPSVPIPGAQAGPIQPGSITYTTTTDVSGQVVYHPFKAVPATYETPQGLVTGIQWVPAEATRMLPMGATPATADILASFQRPGSTGSYRDDWQREDDRRRRKDEDRDYRREEKDRRRLEREEDRLEKEIRRAREREREERDSHRKSGYGYERDLDRSMRDLDLREREKEREYENAKARSRTGSMYGDPNAAYGASPAPGAGYAAGGYPASTYGAPGTTAPYPQGGGAYAQGRPASPYQPGGGVYAQGRPASPYQPGGVIPGRPVTPIYAPTVAQPRAASPYQIPGALPRAASPYQIPGALPRAASPYQVPQGPPPRSASPYQQPRSASPYAPPGVMPVNTSPYQSTVTPGTIYPPNHVLAGQPVGGRPLSRAPSPAPGAYGAPAGGYGYGAQQPAYGAAQGGAYGAPGLPQAVTTEQQPMPAPEGFSRPPNLAQPYTRFDTFKCADMDDFFEQIPRMPLVLVPHDVYHDDWIRMMSDLALAWSGKLPVPEYTRDGRPPKRTVLASDLIDLWNTSFFLKRGIEVVLYKGRERRTGRNAGTVDVHLPGLDAAGLSDSSEDDSSSSEDDDEDRGDRHRYGAYGGAYGRQQEAALAELQEAKRLRRERKRLEKKRRRQEKKQRRKQKEADRKYSLYITCVQPEL